jgi:ATP-dependent DNA helicase RecG
MRTVTNAKLSFFNPKLLETYFANVKSERKNLAENVSDDEIMELMGLVLDGTPTIAGVMSFSLYPQGFFPQLCITAVSIPGMEMGETGSAGERFIDNQRITGTIPEMLDMAVDFVRRNSRTSTIIDDNGKRHNKPEYPPKAVREAILNGLVHRDYSIHTQNTPVRIEMYRDRIEITNPGGLYGKITIDSLGKLRPDTRNAVLANILELLNVTENRYSGIPTIYSECRAAGLPEPIFAAVRGEFKITIRNNIFDFGNTREHETLRSALLDFCAEPRAREEIIAFTGFSRSYAMRKIVQPLLDAGLLSMTMPDKPKSSLQKFFRN